MSGKAVQGHTTASDGHRDIIYLFSQSKERGPRNFVDRVRGIKVGGREANAAAPLLFYFPRGHCIQFACPFLAANQVCVHFG